MKILLVAATLEEIKPTIEYLEFHSESKNFTEYNIRNKTIMPYITGVGPTMTAFALGRYQRMNEIKLLIHAGLSGAFTRSLEIAQVVEVSSEQFGDLGAEDQDGNILSIFDLNLDNPNRLPFNLGRIERKITQFESKLKKCTGLSVSLTSGSNSRIQRMSSKYKADIESMEGASVFYSACMWDVPLISIRSISNYVEPRNKENWNIPLAIKTLNQFLIDYINQI
ncbi:MAG: futalosine hydrolase [Saprospiraceae bacterium]|nr:futalosine hydrolase [Saprospiraceae bacterium]